MMRPSEHEHDFRFGDSINTPKGVGFVLAVATCLYCNQSIGPKEIEAILNKYAAQEREKERVTNNALEFGDSIIALFTAGEQEDETE